MKKTKNKYLLESYYKNILINTMGKKYGSKYVEYIPRSVSSNITELLAEMKDYKKRDISIFVANRICGFSINELSLDFCLSESQVWRIIKNTQRKIVEQKHIRNVYVAK